MKIPDPNFQLTLLQSLWTAGLAPPFDKEAFFRDVLKQPYDFKALYNNAVDDRVRKALLAEPITEAQLEQLRLIHWDGGDEIHHLIWESWDGEDETFDVHDLTGIEQCTALEQIEFTSGLSASDLTPLSSLQSLREAMLYGHRFDSLDPLRNLTALKKLSIYYVDTSATRAVLDELRHKGVDVSGARPR
jgi:hypothetical protein